MLPLMWGCHGRRGGAQTCQLVQAAPGIVDCAAAAAPAGERLCLLTPGSTAAWETSEQKAAEALPANGPGVSWERKAQENLSEMPEDLFLARCWCCWWGPGSRAWPDGGWTAPGSIYMFIRIYYPFIPSGTWIWGPSAGDGACCACGSSDRQPIPYPALKRPWAQRKEEAAFQGR